jgi:hypothetical protein
MQRLLRVVFVFAVSTLFLSANIPRRLFADDAVIHSAHSGPWSDGGTWEGGKSPGNNARVLIRFGHRVVYDVTSDTPIRGINVAGTLTFAADRDTRLCVGLLKIQDSEEYSEEGFDCEAHLTPPDPNRERPALEVGTAEKPIDAGHTATIRLTYFDGLDKQSCPAIVCCGGRMDLHGAPLDHAWTKLGRDAKKGDANVELSETVAGWRAGDRIIVTATTVDENEQGTRRPSKRNRRVFTEERTVKSVDGKTVTLDRPLEFAHAGSGEFRGEVANLSRNVIVESADPGGVRGHTMYHRHSAGSISYAEFRHLGKEGVLGRYALHYHLVGDTMRGSSVVGASIWDSANRWLTIHSTNFLVVRDCVGYESVGHGFFLEDGTEAYNTLDHNLAVQAYEARPLPKQALPFDQNEGAGFWWGNSLNTFTRNVSCENDRYGFRFQAEKSSAFDPTLAVLQPDGSRRPTDIRTLPFVRFDDNEAHCDGLYGFNLGEGANRVGPDERHPFVIRRMKLWQIHYAFRPQSPSVLVENMLIDHSVYGVYHPNYDHHVYRNLTINGDGSEPFNRGHDDDSIQYGPLAVDGLTFTETRGYPYSIPLIQISDDNPTGRAESHFRNVQVIRKDKNDRRPVADTGGGLHVTPSTAHGVPVYLHDYYGPDRTAKIEATNTKDFAADGQKYRDDSPLTGHEARVAEVHGVTFPELLNPIDDLPPTTVITNIRRDGGKLIVAGTTSDDGAVKRVLVNNREARATRDNFAEWEVVLDATAGDLTSISSHAEDAAGNVEPRAHVVTVR